MSRYFLLMFFFSGIFVMRVNGQMIPAGADTTIVTEYSKTDSIYIFHQLPNTKRAYLSVQSPFKVSSTFKWWKLNNVSLKPELAILSTETSGKDTSKTTSVSTGGYRVDIRSSINLTDSASYFAWILKDTIIIKLNKDQQGYLALGDYTCKYTDLNDSARSDTLKYANPLTLQTYSLGNKLNYSWWSVPTSKNPIVSSDQDNNLVSHVRISPPDYDSTYYYSRVTNQFGLLAEDHVYLKAIVPHAVFDTLGCFNYEKSPQYTALHSAPFTVNFINKSSKNAVKFDWYLDNGKNLYNTRVPKQDSTIYFYAKNRTTGVEANDTVSYIIKLVAKSAELCVDTFKMYLNISVPVIEDWKMGVDTIKIPNVFAPDGTIPFFKPFLASIKQFEITIFTRTGKKVYGFIGSDQNIHDWEGWNGKINNDGADASPGIYYYVINIVPWDLNPGILPKKGQYKGYIYLFR